jgi:hypothetical protein
MKEEEKGEIKREKRKRDGEVGEERRETRKERG